MTTEYSSTLRNGSIDSPDMRRAGKDLLSLALMDARNHTLHLFSQYEAALTRGAPSTHLVVPQLAELNPPLWELGHVGWFQEYWIGRNIQRSLGASGYRHSDGVPARLASIEPHADSWWDSANVPHDTRWSLDLPDLPSTRAYLLDTLESTLEMLEKAADEDDPLYFYRLCLFHEDMHGEAFCYMAQSLGLPLQLPNVPSVSPREPLLVPATRWQLGSRSGGFSFDNERQAYDVPVPEFEIDAQPVSWAQFVEFVDDSGYDRPEFWSKPGWDWLERKAHEEGRRGPRYVEQIGVASGAVMQLRFGKAARMASTQPAMHLSWWEAEAWARWAGRRLPSEVEWEVAAHTAARRGFHWGDVWEWTGTTFAPFPGFEADPYRDYSAPWFGSHRVVRGASFATRARMKHPKYRNFYLPARDDIFVGFRTCAL